MSNPHSPEPARWILEMFAPDIPAWNRAFTQLERKPLTELEEMLVQSFDRYLRRKGYLTKRQVEVLQGIARKHNVPLPQIPPITRETEASQTKQETSPRSALFPITKNPIEHKEVKPEVLARWRTFLPENTIKTLLEHRRLVTEWRKKVGWTEIPDFPYQMPRLPQAEEKPEVLAMAIDTEGWIDAEHRWRENKINEYMRHYQRPEVACETENLELTMKIANMMLATIRPRRPRPPRVPSIQYLTVAGSSRAIMAIYLMQPYLIKWKNIAEKTMQLYRQSPIIRLK